MKKFENFCKAMDNLEDIYKYEEPYDNVVLIGLDALVSCNNVAHAYNQAIAMDIVKNTKERYAGMFRELRDEIRTNWI